MDLIYKFTPAERAAVLKRHQALADLVGLIAELQSLPPGCALAADLTGFLPPPETDGTSASNSN